LKKLLGPHLGGQWIDKLEILRQWQPPFVLVLQPDVDKVAQLREACPGTIITGRFYHEDSHYASNIASRPKEFALEIHNEIMGNPATPLLDYVQSNNEVCQDWAGIQQLNTFALEGMALADQSGAYKRAILAFSVGNPDMPHKPGDPAGFGGRMLYWQQVLPSLTYAQRNNHLLLLHAYGYPNMFAPDADWFIYRYERQVQANLKTLGITSLKYAYGEIGIDRLIVKERGGYKVVTNDQDYVNQLLQWERDQQGQSLLLGGAIFTFGDSGGWDTYDIASGSAASLIAAHYADHANEYKSPTQGASEPMRTFIPAAGTGTTPTEPSLPPVDWDPRLKERGVSIDVTATHDLAPGQQFWRVVKACWYDEQEADGVGPDHHILIDVLDGFGRRVAPGLSLLVEWPGDSTLIYTEAKAGEPWAANYPMSKSLNEFGVRVNDALAPSEVLKGIGMGADGNSGIHTSTGAVFQLVTMPAIAVPTTPTPQEPTQPGKVPALAHPVADPQYRRVTQGFGARPEYYRQFKIDGVPLEGHEGIDFGTPPDAWIVAVDAGRVVEVEDQGAKGYGRYIKIVHSWGESVYAHLGDLLMSLGDTVVAGDVIATSGYTGNVDPPGPAGAHLHFGLRVNPFNRQDGWGGYVDPAPYLINVGTPSQPQPTSQLEIVKVIALAALEFDVDSDLLLSQAWAESSFNPRAVSGAGAKGLLQIMDATWTEWSAKIGAGNDPFDARQNARVGAAYLKWLLGALGNKPFDALVAYGWGIGNVLHEGSSAYPQQWTEYAAKIIHGRDLLKAVG